MERPPHDESTAPEPAEQEGRLGDVRPLGHDEDERPSREDRDYGSTIFTLPDFVTAPFKRRRKKPTD
jgi:hypothetical protein